MIKIVIRKAAAKALRKMDAKISVRFRAAFIDIANDATDHLDIKPLQGLEGFRLRIGGYRAIFTKDFELLDVINVGSRGDIYK